MPITAQAGTGANALGELHQTAASAVALGFRERPAGRPDTHELLAGPGGFNPRWG